MTSRTCGWCARVAHMIPSGFAVTSSPTDIDRELGWGTISAAYRCAHCGRLSIAYLDYNLGWIENYSGNQLTQ